MADVSTSALQKIAEGREAEIFAWGGGAVLRLLRNPDRRTQLEWEAAAMQAAASAGVRVPNVVDIVTVDGRPGLVMERIEGVDMLAVVARQPWMVLSIGATTGRVQAGLNNVAAPDVLPALRDVLRGRIQEQGAISAGLRAFALKTLEDLPDGDRICHGDLHPGNIMRTAGHPVIIDWTNVSRGDATADFVRTQLMLSIGDIPPGQPLVIRYGAKVARGLMLSAHARAYRKDRPVDDVLAARWQVVVAAARIGDGIQPEVPKLLAILERARAAS